MLVPHTFSYPLGLTKRLKEIICMSILPLLAKLWFYPVFNIPWFFVLKKWLFHAIIGDDYPAINLVFIC